MLPVISSSYPPRPNKPQRQKLSPPVAPDGCFEVHAEQVLVNGVFVNHQRHDDSRDLSRPSRTGGSIHGVSQSTDIIDAECKDPGAST